MKGKTRQKRRKSDKDIDKLNIKKYEARMGEVRKWKRKN